ncbi:MAG: D-alanyl-D-alanine carboxypeptidase [Cereibacter sphaeroides]|uniref:D-alanyl-D-alanine carboxypeptidase n=1 Tax=Cereibacter sphaeroides TaxID=1063 RepID=A0A2W5SCN4_CERSP|nr:MAG: D-alanyl-D-alanine carboxypeptidase [Cereibacter sphaeroides]
MAVGIGPVAQPAAAQSSALLPLDETALKQSFDDLAKEMLVPGAVLLLRTPAGEVILTYGQRGLDDPTPVTPDDHIRIGSNTKTMTGTVILQMVQEGSLKLDDPVSKYIPGVPNGENIPLELLLNMRSGLFNYSTTYKMNHILDTQPDKVWTTDELLEIGFSVPPYFPPDQGYRYSNTNTVLLGLIAEKIDGKPLETIFQDRIFGPLGLKNTLLPAPTSNQIPEPYAHGYMYGDNIITLADNSVPPDMIYEAQQGRLKPMDQTFANPSWGWAAGAGISTANDLATYAEALVGGGLLKPEMQKIRMDSPKPANPDDPDSASYGLGIARFGPLYGHTGELPGYNSFMGSDPVNKVTLIVWTNLAPAADGRDPATTIAKSLVGLIYAPPQ